MENISKSDQQNLLKEEQLKSEIVRRVERNGNTEPKQYQQDTAEMSQSIDQSQHLTISQLVDTRSFVSDALKSTYSRLKFLHDSLQDKGQWAETDQIPHIKLFIIDMVNYFLSLLSASDRRTFIHELYEQQQVLETENHNSQIIQNYLKKTSDLEFRTLSQINDQIVLQASFHPVQILELEQSKLSLDSLSASRAIISQQSMTNKSRFSTTPVTPLNFGIDEMRMRVETLQAQAIQTQVTSILTDLKSGEFKFQFKNDGINQKTYQLDDISKCEFVGQIEKTIAVKSAENQIEIIDSDTLGLICKLDVDQPKCIYSTEKFVYVGTWLGQVMVYDLNNQYSLVKCIKTQNAVRTICQFDESLVVIGQNDGWINVIRHDATKLESVSQKRFEKIGHIFQVQTLVTAVAGQVVVCGYTGIYFVLVSENFVTKIVTLHLNVTAYKMDIFVNKVIEYVNSKFLAATWDNNKFIFIDHDKEKIITTIEHPKPGASMRCWGFQKASDFDYTVFPFVFARDNTGLIIINVRTHQAIVFNQSPITVSLYGHGDLLRVAKTAQNGIKIVTLIQESESGYLLSAELPEEIAKALLIFAEVS